MTDATTRELEALAQRVRVLEERLRRDKHADRCALRRELEAAQDAYNRLEFVVRDSKPRLTLAQLNRMHAAFWSNHEIA